MEKCKLELIGITYNQIESGVYAVILQQEGGTRRIPIIIGYPEAQAIECKLQEVLTPRPLTHDLMVSMMSTFGISLREVNIYKLPNGVFAAELVLQDGESTHVIDSRSSDGIALAIRVGAPIYTTPQVLAEAGFEPGEKNTCKKSTSARISQSTPNKVTFKADMDIKSIEELRADMQKASEAENYEEAARIKEEIDRRLDSQQGV
ncbi:MAG: bifunctional nuclease family protein [Candidatus Amulumruptor caecigallinarius]|nr:bifunctional nuclease family protein [Candidatus Amulumruptor caecigallinarius]